MMIEPWTLNMKHESYSNNYTVRNYILLTNVISLILTSFRLHFHLHLCISSLSCIFFPSSESIEFGALNQGYFRNQDTLHFTSMYSMYGGKMFNWKIFYENTIVNTWFMKACMDSQELSYGIFGFLNFKHDLPLFFLLLFILFSIFFFFIF